MFRVALQSVLARKLRMVLTSIAIVLGVGFVASAFFLTDSMSGAFSKIYAENAKRVDIEVQTKAYNQYTKDAQSGQSFVPNDLSKTGMSDADITKIRDVSGVADAFGSVFENGGTILKNGKPIVQSNGAPSFIAGWDSNAQELTGVTFPVGHAPSGPDEIAIDAHTVKAGKLSPGDKVQVVVDGGREIKSFTYVGRYKSPGMDSIGGSTVALFDIATAQKLVGAPGHYSIVDVKVDSGAKVSDVKSSIADALGSKYLVQTAKEYGAEQQQSMQDGFIGFFQNFILVFAGIAVFVGLFTIFNTFTIITSQRTREFGMLRTIGAKRSSVLWIVIIEALITGIVASTIGIAVGWLIAEGLRALFNNVLDFGLPTSTMSLTWKIIWVSYAVGVLATLIASLVPAWRASRLAPLEALRLSAGQQRRRWIAPLIGTLFALIGAVIVIIGLNPRGTATTSQIMWTIGSGAALVVLGVALMARLFIKPVTTVLAPVFAPGTTGRVASRNMVRNPARSATTAVALMIGLALATLVLVLYASTGRTLEHEIATSMGNTDFLVQNRSSGNQISSVSDRAVEKIRSTDGVKDAYTSRAGQATLGSTFKARGKNTLIVAAFDPGSIGRNGAFDVTLKSGTLDYAPGSVMVESDFAKSHHLRVGDNVTFAFPSGDPLELKVTGIFKQSASLGTGVVMSTKDFIAHNPPSLQGALNVFGTVDSGESTKTVIKRIKDNLGSEKNLLQINDNSGLVKTFKKSLRPLLGFILAMLCLSLVIALFGIANTLALNVFDRTREIGLLRAVGGTRGQLRRMILIESVLVAVFGAIVGTILGILGGAALVSALKDQGFLLSVSPVFTLVILLAGIVAGVIAALFPARRAARMDVLAAIQHE